MNEEPDRLVKSKQRVADHGEVFTPAWMVEAMLDLVKDETERIDSRFLEPACGSGNFLVQILKRKLAAVEIKYGKSDFEKQHYALLALMSAYGIELLADNIVECRENILEIFSDYLHLGEADSLYRAASFVLSQNIVQGDALTMKTPQQSGAILVKESFNAEISVLTRLRKCLPLVNRIVSLLISGNMKYLHQQRRILQCQ
jgi:hypothetical protein